MNTDTARRPKRESSADRFWRELMAERIVYGGYSMTRLACVRIMRAAGVTDDRCVDFFAMGPADRYGRDPNHYPRIEDHPEMEAELRRA